MTTHALAYVNRPQEASGTEKKVYLHPGHLYFGSEPVLLSTVLGSCVSVCLFDEWQTAAGVNHFILPERAARLESPRFGDDANEMLFDRLSSLGVPTSRLRAKVFGGASMAGVREGDLASRNVEVALDFLRRRGIPLTGQDTGGARGRKLIVDTGNGSAWVRLL